MKKCALQIVSICLAIFITYISGGLNIYHYCCDACREHGHDIFQTISCEEVHKSMHNAQCTIHNYKNDSLHECNICKGQCTACCCKNKVSICKNNETKVSDADHCGIIHIEAPYLSQFNPLKVNFISPLVAILPISMHNAQCTIHNTECKKQSEAIPLVQNLTGRAIIVRKSVYLI